MQQFGFWRTLYLNTLCNQKYPVIEKNKNSGLFPTSYIKSLPKLVSVRGLKSVDSVHLHLTNDLAVEMNKLCFQNSPCFNLIAHDTFSD